MDNDFMDDPTRLFTKAEWDPAGLIIFPGRFWINSRFDYRSH